VLLGNRLIVSSRQEPLPTNKAGALMNALIAAAVLLPATAILALVLLARNSTSCFRRRAAAATAALNGDDGAPHGAAMLAAAAAAAAECVQQGSCGKLVRCADSGAMHLQLPVKKPAGFQASSTALHVTAGRPQLQSLVEGWVAMLRQLPQAADGNEDAATGNKHKKAAGQKAGSKVVCAVYAMGPAPLVADAQVLCGGMKGVHFVQKTYQL
jgi:hypothetical protein